MVSLEVVQQSNKLLGSLPQCEGLVAVFVGATSGIGLSALEHLARSATAPRIYSAARAQTAAAHKAFLETLHNETDKAGQGTKTGAFTMIDADASLVQDMDRLATAVAQREAKVDLIVLSAGFFAFEGRIDTVEGLDPSMSTRYYARIRLVERLLPLLDAAPHARVVWVLAAGEESPLNEDDLDLRQPENWSLWNASRHACTMSTLALERIARDHPRLSITHWFPGPVQTPGLERSNANGLNPPNPRTQDEAGQRVVFLATSDRYALNPGWVPVPAGLQRLPPAAGGIFMVGADGELKDNQAVLGPMREKGLDERVWAFTQAMFEEIGRH
ncbi:uncharacterized protein RCC_08517 [Ramularia collo-cygni]|uniref:Dehydrogenase/reductase n=1 Tax=Ramularia collo-cygni TaxID=112498 RepID=A0A2D3VFD8_9PEZI|nr:uncharacterized protein RCC_08517 [Ramularia collo-cygni]CZT22811.1 uncharacterized protein RCC_08517 [Ramularia collo-cygni]